MATKGKNNTTKSSSKNKSNRGNSKSNTKANTRTKQNKSSRNSRADTNKKTRNFEDEVFFEDTKKDLVLWVTIALGILFFISNFGWSGTVGVAIGNFLFGVFGIVQYVLPVLMIVGAFFLVSNFNNIVAVVKSIAASIFVLLVSVITELIIHKEETVGPLAAFEYSKNYHNGGGLIGGFISFELCQWFGLFGAYIVTLIAMIICIVIITESFAFARVQKQSQYHADRAAMKRRERRERQEMEREASISRLEAERRSRQEKIQNQLLEQAAFDQNDEGSRLDRKRTGITTNTTIVSDVPIPTNLGSNSSDDISEIRFNMMEGQEETEVTQTSRKKLRSNDKSSRSGHSFNEIERVEETVDTISKTDIVSEPENVFVSESIRINTPAPIEEKNSIETSSASAEELGESHRKSKASMSTKDEIEKGSESLRDAIMADDSKPKKPYRFPPFNLLNEAKRGGGDSKEYLNEMAAKLQRTLSNFGVEAIVKEVTLGPSVTRYEIEIAEGTKVSKVVNLSDDIKLSLAVTDVRIEAPIPGKSAIGIEVPNKEKSLVGFRELVQSKKFRDDPSKISFCVGKDISGDVIVGNIAKMPHLLIAGATGSGKSVCINTIIMSILYHASPDDVKLIMVDPKKVELSVYNGIPHLLTPVVTDAKKAAGALHWAVKEMMDRYELLEKVGVRNLENYNEKFDNGTLADEFPNENFKRMTQIVIILDELADLMMVAAADVEDSIVRLAQLARACGIHLIVATQRPTANVITGLIKANIPSRIAFSVSSSTDSRVILDMNGAEDLLGNGDMLYAPQNLSKPIRVQGAFVTDEEVAKVVSFLKDNNDMAEYNETISDSIASAENGNNSVSISGDYDDSKDALFAEAGRLVIESQKGSIGYLQRNFRIGFNRAARIMDQLCEAGVVGPEVGTKPREIRMSSSEFEEYLQNK